MNTFAFVFARGGSKGVPGKNIREMCGKPLLAYSIEVAQQIEEISQIFVSTDDTKIANIAEVIMRPDELAQDNSPEWMAWIHAIKYLQDQGRNFERFVSLPTTSPMRNKEDVINCLNLLDSETDFVVSMTETNRSPFFNMVCEVDGYINLLVENKNQYSRRQDVPKAYDMTTVAYIARPEFILNNNRIFDGRVKSGLIPNERAFDIDTELDFKIVELLMREQGENKC
jgi:N-acylneuraminate cytidylyltransferase